MRQTHDPLIIEDVECLISWPDNTVGYDNEKILLQILIKLCEEQGYGRVPQLANKIEEIWRDPSKQKEYEQERKEHLARLSKGQEEYKRIRKVDGFPE